MFKPNINESEDTFMHKAERPQNYFFSNCFTQNKAELIKKGVICVQILFEIHLTEHSIVHFQG